MAGQILAKKGGMRGRIRVPLLAALACRALEFKTDQRASRGQCINRAVLRTACEFAYANSDRLLPVKRKEDAGAEARILLYPLRDYS
jgi:hypothetical protein